MQSNINEKQRVLIVWAYTGNENKIAVIDELKGLIDTAGGETVDVMIQNRESIDISTVIGSGKLAELSAYAEGLNIDLIVFENALSPAQTRNIEKEITCCRVIDRTTLILDIFALHAVTAEGKLQVELAQLKYLYPRLTGSNTQLSRLAGGIGTRGPGETKLETDRRYIKNRINTLQKRIKDLEFKRSELHKRRIKNQVFSVVLVGYTNAGKSSLLNALTNSDIYVENKLFATLDPSARKLNLGKNTEIILIDTVGFIRNIPTDLVAAFKSTLEEVVYADVIVNVCDVSNPECELQREVTLSTLQSLNATAPIITVYNKCDMLPKEAILGSLNTDVIMVSAKQKIGLENVAKSIEQKLFGEKIYCEFAFPYSNAKELAELRNCAQILKESYNEKEIIIKCDVIRAYLNKFSDFISEKHQ